MTQEQQFNKVLQKAKGLAWDGSNTIYLPMTDADYERLENEDNALLLSLHRQWMTTRRKKLKVLLGAVSGTPKIQTVTHGDYQTIVTQ